ncbi:MAG: zinc-ribbon domain-containing protein [Rhodobacteraceae bacterium]|nr:zinc-ribbon domain-containing protein [Paracoccaceae bacterium]
MRLICPSCGAQYEVDESVIPDGGRDVQCSNCGHAWFQRSAKQLKADAEEEQRRTEEAARAEAEARQAEAKAAEDAAAAEAEAEAEAGDDGEGDEAPPPPPVEERPRKTLDDAVRNVLREEAEREARARQAEASAFESQPDLGLASAAAAAAAAASSAPEEPRYARTAEELSDFDDDALVSRASRRELLPDIEEINSTLRPTSERDGEAAAIDAPQTLARRKSGFRLGFSTAILVAVLLLGAYLLAPMLARAVPALEPALSGYVAAVDSVRGWLDGKMRSMTETLQSTSTSGN